MRELDVSRTALFDIPIWTAQFDEILPYHEQMAEEVEGLIDDTSAEEAPRYLAHQTPTDPFTLPSEGWRILERLSNDVYTDLAKRYFQRWRSGEFHLRRWAIRLGRLDEADKARLARDSVHNHLPALFSSIYYLRIPNQFVDNPDGGTRFINPIGSLMDLMGPRTTSIAPREGRFLVFPGFVDHTPIPIEWDADDVSRIVLSSDVFYVSGQRRQDNRETVVRAEPAST